MEPLRSTPLQEDFTDIGKHTGRKIKLNVNSEIGKLQAVLLHRPGRELEKLTPDLLKTLLFDDIPWLKQMREEHDKFADLLRQRGAEVLYVDQMLSEILEDDAVKDRFVSELLADALIENEELREVLFDDIRSRPPREVTEIAIAGLLKKDIRLPFVEKNLWDYIRKDYPLYIDPIPNIYFMRDPAAVVGDGLSVSRMYTRARSREPKIVHYIYNYHPVFESTEKTLWYNENMPNSIEGGDMLMLSKRTIAIGCSQRTSPGAIERIARNLFKGREELKEILAIRIPATRAFMHLDTVFTMIDYDKFAIYPGISDQVEVYKLTRGKGGGVHVSSEADLSSALKRSLRLSAVDLIPSGGGDAVTAAREQWNDSTNILAIAPSVVVTYCRNERSNEALRRHGVYVLEIGGSELVRGRGGPRCMSCPLSREDD
ncbi:MAG: arginine deiminase [Clostridiales Family XIII bacterium]|jgi:arginine deiminase|nr:arginine deiminase [Clostridiales Family XIII bacterium]